MSCAGLDGVGDARVLLEELDRRDVPRLADRLAHRHRPVVLQIGVLRPVAATEVGTRVHDDRGRRRPLLQCGEVVEHLERRARLPQADTGDVELPLDPGIGARVVVRRPDVGKDLARTRVERRERGVPDVAPVQPIDVVLHLPLGGLLDPPVERGRDPEPAARHGTLVTAEDVGELVPDLEHEMRRPDRRDPWPDGLDRLGVGGGLLRRRDRVDAHHLVEHIGPPDLRALGVRDLRRVEDRRRLRQSGEQRGLREGELPQVGHAEVRRSRGLHAVRAVPVVDLVEVQLQDLLLGVGPGHARPPGSPP